MEYSQICAVDVCAFSSQQDEQQLPNPQQRGDAGDKMYVCVVSAGCAKQPEHENPDNAAALNFAVWDCSTCPFRLVGDCAVLLTPDAERQQTPSSNVEEECSAVVVTHICIKRATSIDVLRTRMRLVMALLSGALWELQVDFWQQKKMFRIMSSKVYIVNSFDLRAVLTASPCCCCAVRRVFATSAFVLISRPDPYGGMNIYYLLWTDNANNANANSNVAGLVLEIGKDFDDVIVACEGRRAAVCFAGCSVVEAFVRCAGQRTSRAGKRNEESDPPNPPDACVKISSRISFRSPVSAITWLQQRKEQNHDHDHDPSSLIVCTVDGVVSSYTLTRTLADDDDVVDECDSTLFTLTHRLQVPSHLTDQVKWIAPFPSSTHNTLLCLSKGHKQPAFTVTLGSSSSGSSAQQHPEASPPSVSINARVTSAMEGLMERQRRDEVSVLCVVPLQVGGSGMLAIVAKPTTATPTPTTTNANTMQSTTVTTTASLSFAAHGLELTLVHRCTRFRCFEGVPRSLRPLLGGAEQHQQQQQQEEEQQQEQQEGWAPCHASDFQHVRRLGAGACGEVFLSLHKPTGRHVAVKTVAANMSLPTGGAATSTFGSTFFADDDRSGSTGRNDDDDDDCDDVAGRRAQQLLLREMSNARSLPRHQHVVRCHGMYVAAPSNSSDYATAGAAGEERRGAGGGGAGRCHIVMELADTSLATLLFPRHNPQPPVPFSSQQQEDQHEDQQEERCFSAFCQDLVRQRQLRGYLFQALLGLRHLHQHQLLHRDVKPENILVKFTDFFSATGPCGWAKAFKRVTLLLADFGVSALVDSCATQEHTVVGTPAFAAPEIMQKWGLCPTSSYSATADVFSLGAVFYCAVLGRECGVVSSVSEIADLVSGRLQTLQQRQNQKQKQQQDSVSPSAASSFSDVSSLLSLLDEMMRFVPSERPKADVCLRHRCFRPPFQQDFGLSEANGADEEPSPLRLVDCWVVLPANEEEQQQQQPRSERRERSAPEMVEVNVFEAHGDATTRFVQVVVVLSPPPTRSATAPTPSLMTRKRSVHQNRDQHSTQELQQQRQHGNNNNDPVGRLCECLRRDSAFAQSPAPPFAVSCAQFPFPSGGLGLAVSLSFSCLSGEVSDKTQAAIVVAVENAPVSRG